MRLAAEDRRAQLIEVAMQLFASQGFDGTTTRAIAEAAGVNEALIFRHFPTKEDLYWAVVSSRMSQAGRRRRIRDHLDSGAGPLEALSGVAEALLHRTPEDAALTRLLLFSALRNSHLAENFFLNYVAENYQLLAEYFGRGEKLGWFRKADPLIAARGFLGMIWQFILVQEVFGGARYQQLDPKLVARELVDVWLNGLSSPASNSADTRRHLSPPAERPANGGSAHNGNGKPKAGKTTTNSLDTHR